MSELHQSGHHPDADQLNAFVEHALPLHEREQTLAHLAGCPACRSIVSLSLPPVDEAGHTHPEPARRPWFLGWNLAWPVAVAFASLVPLVLYIHRTETDRSRIAVPTETATSQPPAAPPAPAASAPMLADKAPSPHAAAEKPASPPAATASPSGKRPEPAASPPPSAPIASAQIIASGAAVSSPTPAAGSPQSAAASPGTARFSAGLGGSGGSRPAAPDRGNSGIYGGTGQANLNENYVAGVPAASPSPPPPPASATAASAGAAMAAATTVTVTDAPPMLETSDATLGGLQLRVAAPEAPLPSGLPALSTATRGRLALALDTANTLFFSDDVGRHWKPVPAQWKGRAVSVKLAVAPARGTAQATGAGLGGFAAGALAATLRQNSGANSGVSGIVTDPTGAVIPDASIVVTDTAKQVFRNARTDAAGRYRINGLATGSYQLEARAPGFQALDLPITLAASQQSLANLTLQVGATTEAVAVAAAPSFETDESARIQSQKKAFATAIQPAPLFEITTESGERWISPDGQTWTRRP